MRNKLYLECTSGISGDMTVAALLDLGADQKKLVRTLKGLPVKGFDIKISRVMKSGIDACDFDVLLDHDHENHDHDMKYLYGHDGDSHSQDHEEHHYQHSHEALSIPILMNIMYRKPMETVIHIQKRCIPTTDTITMNTVALTRSWRLSTMQI